MEYLPRGSLRGHIGRLTLAQIAGVLEGVLAGLAHGESHGIVHRDLKPENLLVAADGRVKIADFGVARAYNQAAPRAFVTATGTTIGTPAYMAPEQALGGRLTPATDLYSLGIIVWEALAGHPPFAGGDTPVALLYRQVHEPVPPISDVRPDLDQRVVAWLARILNKAPEERFQSAQEAWDAFEDIAIELLGPRWRRQARISAQPANGASAPAGRRRVAPTISDHHPAVPPAAAPGAGAPGAGAVSAGPPATGAPAAGAQTIMRAAQRHRHHAVSADLPAGAPRARARAALGAMAALVLAAAVGLLAGHLAAGRVRTRTRTLPALSSPSAAAALAPVIGRLAQRRRLALDELARAHTPTAQATAASAIAGDYAVAAQALAHGADPGKTGVIASAMVFLAAEWRRLAADARGGHRAAYARERSLIAAAQRRLSAQLGSLSA